MLGEQGRRYPMQRPSDYLHPGSLAFVPGSSALAMSHFAVYRGAPLRCG